MMYFDNHKFNAAFAVVAAAHPEWKDRSSYKAMEVEIARNQEENRSVRIGSGPGCTIGYRPVEAEEPYELRRAKNIIATELDKIIEKVMSVFKDYSQDTIDELKGEAHQHCWRRMRYYDPSRTKAFNFFTSVIINKVRTDIGVVNKNGKKIIRIGSIPGAERIGIF